MTIPIKDGKLVSSYTEDLERFAELRVGHGYVAGNLVSGVQNEQTSAEGRGDDSGREGIEGTQNLGQNDIFYKAYWPLIQIKVSI